MDEPENVDHPQQVLSSGAQENKALPMNVQRLLTRLVPVGWWGQ